MRLFSNVWSENTALFERLMEIHSNSPKLYYGFKEYYVTFCNECVLWGSCCLHRKKGSVTSSSTCPLEYTAKTKHFPDLLAIVLESVFNYIFIHVQARVVYIFVIARNPCLMLHLQWLIIEIACIDFTWNLKLKYHMRTLVMNLLWL